MKTLLKKRGKYPVKMGVFPVKNLLKLSNLCHVINYQKNKHKNREAENGDKEKAIY